MNKLSLISVLLFAIAVLIACERQGLYEGDETKKVNDLSVPDGFDWETSKDITLTISAPIETSAGIYEDEACKQLLAVVPVTPQEVSYYVSIPKGAEKVYVQYTKKDGTKATLPVSYAMDTRSNGAVTKLPEDTGEWNVGGDYFFMYPNTGWGTLLFEDMWPIKGDYDLNDVAAWYRIELKDVEKQKFNIIQIGLRLNALGGNYPYQLCLQMDDLHSRDISEINIQGGGSAVLENEGESAPAIFSFDWGKKKGTHGGQYYNTEREYQVDQAELASNVLQLTIKLKKPAVSNDNSANKQFSHESFNFFIRRDDGHEIHMRGYEATKDFHKKYQEIWQKNENLSRSVRYCTTDGFVWGMKVRTVIDHAVERVDFTQAYTRFADWVESGGQRYTNWYDTSKQKNNCIEME